MLRFLAVLQFSLFIFFTVAYAYQLVYLVIGLLSRERRNTQRNVSLHRYAAVIAARNEQEVIGELIESLKAQDYPAELLGIFVVADNCTDETAQAARKAGATVYERRNRHQVGKGYALDYLFRNIFQDYGEQTYDGFFVFDADNLVDAQFVREMNKLYDTGEYAALTSYRNSRNFCDNWITAGYSLWFIREARLLNRPRARLGMSCAVSGTGFLIAADVIRAEGGWPYHLMTEDIEFSIHCAIQGRRIGYCGAAIVYDEQPTKLRQSWDQRLRWSRGFYQVTGKYSGALLRGCMRGGRKGMSCYDLLMIIAPCNLLSIGILLLAAIVCMVSLSQPAFIIYRTLRFMGRMIVGMAQGVYLSMLLFGAATLLTEWKRIEGKAWKKLLYLFTFPLFMMTYIPISLAALVSKVEWKPIRHGMYKMRRQGRNA